jgi:hypothetical protein
MRNLTAAELSFTYDKDSLTPSFSFFGIYIFLGFREFPIRKISDKTLLSDQTFTSINTPTPITKLNLFNQIIDSDGISALKSENFYSKDEPSEDNFRLGSIYLTDKLIFKDTGLDIEAGIKIKDIVLTLTFVNPTSPTDTRKLEYKPTVAREYTFTYLNGEKIYLIHTT